MKSGVDVKLPETDPQARDRRAAALAARVARPRKDVLALDFRAPGRVFVRLTEEAAAAREARTRQEKGAQP